MRAATRPRWHGPSAPGIRGLRIATLVATVLGAVATLAVIPTLPETIPTHFGVTGEADAFGPRWTLAPLAGAWLALQLLVAWLSTRPEWAQVPGPIADDRVDAVHREVERMLVLLGAAVAVVLGGIVLAILVPGGIAVAAIGLAGVVLVTALGLQRVLAAA